MASGSVQTIDEEEMKASFPGTAFPAAAATTTTAHPFASTLNPGATCPPPTPQPSTLEPPAHPLLLKPQTWSHLPTPYSSTLKPGATCNCLSPTPQPSTLNEPHSTPDHLKPGRPLSHPADHFCTSGLYIRPAVPCSIEAHNEAPLRACIPGIIIIIIITIIIVIMVVTKRRSGKNPMPASRSRCGTVP